MKYLKFFIHLIIVLFLTVVTQVGGAIWLVVLISKLVFKLKRFQMVLVFMVAYLFSTVVLIPRLAQIDGRVPLPISKSGKLVPHNYMTVLLNRHYVKKRLAADLNEIAKAFDIKYPGAKLTYLDANFPFVDGFPLLPHRSHDDGRKVDISFMYKRNGQAVNTKPARSGYGYYEEPKSGEYNMPKECIDRGFWQYDFPKYLTLGSSDKYIFDEKRTKDLIYLILNRSTTQKVFIEPHLKSRLTIDHAKCRYHGCRAVRHDDHIHYQIK